MSSPYYTDQNGVIIKLRRWLQHWVRGAVLVSGEESAVELAVCAGFHSEVERQAALISQTLHRAVQSVEHSLDRDRRHVQKDARVFDEVGVRTLGPSAKVLLRGRIFKHQQQETREDKHWGIQPLHDVSQDNSRIGIERMFSSCYETLIVQLRPSPPVVGRRDCRQVYIILQGLISSRKSKCCMGVLNNPAPVRICMDSARFWKGLMSDQNSSDKKSDLWQRNAEEVENQKIVTFHKVEQLTGTSPKNMSW